MHRMKKPGYKKFSPSMTIIHRILFNGLLESAEWYVWKQSIIRKVKQLAGEI